MYIKTCFILQQELRDLCEREHKQIDKKNINNKAKTLDAKRVEVKKREIP